MLLVWWSCARMKFRSHQVKLPFTMSMEELQMLFPPIATIAFRAIWGHLSPLCLYCHFQPDTHLATPFKLWFMPIVELLTFYIQDRHFLRHILGLNWNETEELVNRKGEFFSRVRVILRGKYFKFDSHPDPATIFTSHNMYHSNARCCNQHILSCF